MLLPGEYVLSLVTDISTKAGMQGGTAISVSHMESCI